MERFRLLGEDAGQGHSGEGGLRFSRPVRLPVVLDELGAGAVGRLGNLQGPGVRVWPTHLTQVIGQVPGREEQGVVKGELDQGVLEVEGGLEAVVRLVPQGPDQQGVGAGRDVRAVLQGAHGLGVDLVGCAQHVRHKQPLTGEHLVEADRQGVQVASLIKGVRAKGLLWRHVTHLPLDPVEDRLVGGGLGDAEVGELHLAGHGEHHVAGRDVPVDQAQVLAVEVMLLVGVGQGAEHLPRDEERRRRGEAIPPLLYPP